MNKKQKKNSKRTKSGNIKVNVDALRKAGIISEPTMVNCRDLGMIPFGKKK